MSAKSPRMVPGADSAGLVVPSIIRPVLAAFLPSQTIDTTGPDNIYPNSAGKNGFEASEITVVRVGLRQGRGNKVGNKVGGKNKVD